MRREAAVRLPLGSLRQCLFHPDRHLMLSILERSFRPGHNSGSGPYFVIWAQADPPAARLGRRQQSVVACPAPELERGYQCGCQRRDRQRHRHGLIPPLITVVVALKVAGWQQLLQAQVRQLEPLGLSKVGAGEEGLRFQKASVVDGGNLWRAQPPHLGA